MLLQLKGFTHTTGWQCEASEAIWSASAASPARGCRAHSPDLSSRARVAGVAMPPPAHAPHCRLDPQHPCCCHS